MGEPPPHLRENKMSEILLRLALGVFRFSIGLPELFGTGGLFSSKTLLATRNRLRPHKAAAHTRRH